MSKKQFGKVPTPVKVVYSRMPAAFGMFVGKIAKLDKKLTLPAETQFLIREQVAQSTCASSAWISGAIS